MKELLSNVGAGGAGPAAAAVPSAGGAAAAEAPKEEEKKEEEKEESDDDMVRSHFFVRIEVQCADEARWGTGLRSLRLNVRPGVPLFHVSLWCSSYCIASRTLHYPHCVVLSMSPLLRMPKI